MLRALLLLLLLAAGGFLYWRVGTRGETPPSCHVILVVIDTCRADRTGFNGFALQDGSSPTPNLDTLAAGSTRLRWGLSPIPLTLPATVSIMSGLYPDGHGVRENDSFRVPDPDQRDWSLLAEDLRASGYQTAAFISGQPLDRKFGLAAGFMTYDPQTWKQDPEHHMQLRERPAQETTDAALAYLEGAGSDPLFLFVHYFDPHMPYEDAMGLPAPPPNPRERAYVSEIARVDREIGRLLAGLPDDGRPRLILVVGDHGEALGEHGEATHGLLLYEGTLRVPFLMKLPEGTADTVDPGVPPRLVDIHSTVLAVTGAAAVSERSRDGRSLLDPAEDSWFHRAETLYGFYQLRYARVRSFRDRQHKLIEAGRLQRLFDWTNDPAERDDLADQRSGDRDRLKDSLLTTLQNRTRGAADYLAVEPDSATPYMGLRSRGTPLEPSEEENDRLRPAELGMEVIRTLDLARQLIRQGEFGRAAMLLEGFEKERVNNPALLFWTARAHQRCDELAGLTVETKLDRLQKAMDLFQQHVTRFRSTRAMDSILRVRMRRRHHRWMQAQEAPDDAARRGFLDQARGELEAICRDVSARRGDGSLTVIALASMGQALQLLGRLEEALAVFEEALGRDPDHVLLLRDVKRLRAELGR